MLANQITKPVEKRDIPYLMGELNIVPVFQPIIDFKTSSVFGYEALSRPMPPFRSAEELFGKAKQYGIIKEIESFCLNRCIERLSLLRDNVKNKIMFINFSPEMLNELSDSSGEFINRLLIFGIDTDQIVVEITESTAINDIFRLENSLDFFSDMGFKIAVDGFGSSRASLSDIIQLSPDYIKLHRDLCSDVSKTLSKQYMIKAILSYAEATSSKVIAEGIENWNDFEAIIKLGVRYGQGFLIGRPNENLISPDESFFKKNRVIVKKYFHSNSSTDISIRDMIDVPYIVEVGTMTCEDIFLEMKDNYDIDHILVTKKGRPFGIITRQLLLARGSGEFGYSLIQKKPVEYIAKLDPLIIRSDSDIMNLARLAMDRLQDDVYDPVIVVDDNKKVLGTITIKQLISRASKLEVMMAKDSNPLTNLPGNRSIEQWISKALACNLYSVAYIDLDHFKEFNDAYGFMSGDEMIKTCAKVLDSHMAEIADESYLGHVGGDDFIIVSMGEISGDTLSKICRSFDEEKCKLFNEKDVANNWYISTDRQGRQVKTPLTTVSISVVDSSCFATPPHPAQLAQAAAGLKKKTKKQTCALGRSGFMYERRQHV